MNRPITKFYNSDNINATAGYRQRLTFFIRNNETKFFIRNSLFSKLYKISADSCFSVFVFNTVFMYLITVTNYHTNIVIKHGLITGSMA